MAQPLDITYLGVQTKEVYYQLNSNELVEQSLQAQLGTLADSGALCVKTGKFTGRSPEDRFIVKDNTTTDTVDWGKVNIAFDSNAFDLLYDKVMAHWNGKSLYARDAYACADPSFKLQVRVITETPWANLFVNNLFLRPETEDLQNFKPDWHVINAPSFEANPEIDGTRQANFAIINFTRKIVLIGGTGYTGEIKKSIFSILNYLLPLQGVLSMHCSANIGQEGDTALFFGLSGTGKTTLSADPNRKLIGDDEHGWSDTKVFNFEGGCYAKCIDLSPEKEPQIFNAIKTGTLLENTVFLDGTNTVDFTSTTITENTRAAYPIHFIDNIVQPSIGDIPKNIFFLTCDAYGVLPPISKLDTNQAMYHFLSGFTAKVAGTEVGVTEPKLTFSACFGAPFLPLAATKYAALLGEKLNKGNINVWLLNTGWTSGSFGIGYRMKLPYTRAMITAAITGKLNEVDYATMPIFGLRYPNSCPEVPSELLNPRNTWADKDAYDNKCTELAQKFNDNFSKFESYASDAIKAAAPRIGETV